MVLLNRGTRARRVHIPEVKGKFQLMEMTAPYSPNHVQLVPETENDGSLEVAIEPGSIVTLSNVRLGKLPEGFTLN